MQRWTRFVLAHRLAVTASLVLITAASGAMCTQAVIASSVARLFLGDSPDYLRYLDRIREFGSDEVALFGYESDDLLAPVGIERLRAAVHKIQEMPEIGRVDTLLDVQQIARVDDGLRVTRYVDEAELEPDSRTELLAALQQDPNARGTLIAPDGRAASVIIEFLPDASRPAERGPLLLKAIHAAFAEAGFAPESLHTTGMLPALSEAMDASRDSLGRLFPLVTLVLLVTVLLLFKGLLPVVVSMGVSMLAVAWTAGFAVAMDREVSILMAMVPAVALIAMMMIAVCGSVRIGLWSMVPNGFPLLVLGGWVGLSWGTVDSDTFAIAMLAVGIGVDDTIHFLSRYRIESQRCEDDAEAISRTFDFAGRAIIMTTVILVLGFMPLGLSSYFSTQIMGTLLPMTLAVALLADLLLVPALVRLGPMATRRS